MAEILISADNLGEIPFQIVMIEGSFRAASDYSFVMQNVRARAVPSGQRAQAAR